MMSEVEKEPSKLLNYLIVVGPSTEIPNEVASPGIPELNPSSSPTSAESEWSSIFKPGPAILRRFPEVDDPKCPLANNVVYFCQPEGCVKERKKEASHIFMLTNTETNMRTYGTCISFPHLIDPLARAQSHDWQYENQDSVSIQEWGLLSICLLSQYQCFRFFKQCVRTLIHFVEKYCGSRLSWDLLIHSKFIQDDDPNYAAIKELEIWIDNLLQLPAPKDGSEILEVELEVDPALLIGFPPLSRLPLFDLPVHELFDLLNVPLVIEIFELLLLEQKVILHSDDQGLVSQCILTFVTLLYPLQYLFPIIPLLPTCLPNVENLLLVPTPYFIGVCTSFLEKVCTYHCAEAWIINLDDKSTIEPKMHKLTRPQFPLSLLSLQADVRRSLDRLSPGESPESSSDVSLQSPGSEGVSLEDEIDVQIRLAFADFLLGNDMLGLVESHVAIYRLFPRPVVTLKLSSFLKSYPGDKEFMKMFIRSQSVEYYLEWSLNPTNKAFEEIRKGLCNTENIGDKVSWWIQRTRPSRKQYTLYTPDPSSLLYHEMLNHKATQSTCTLKHTYSMSDDSEFELVGHEYYNGGSDITSSYYSDTGSSPFPAGSQSTTGPVVIEFHPATPIYTPAPPTKKSENTRNETYLSLQENGSSNEIELQEITIFNHAHDDIIPESLPHENSSPECISISGDDTLCPAHKETNEVVMGGANMGGALPEGEESDTDVTLPIDRSDDDQILAPPDNRRAKSVELPTVVGTYDDQIDRISPSLNPVRGGGLFSDPAYLSPHLNTGNGLSKKQSVSSDELRTIPKSSSWMNLTGGSVEMLQLSASSQQQSTNGRGSPSVPTTLQEERVARTVPWSAVSSLHELEMQIKDIVGRIGDGHGLPWYKTQSLKTIAAEERSRIALLRVLEVRLAVRKQTETKLSANGEIKPVVLTKNVYKGVLELLKYMLQFIEAELLKDLETPVFSLFLILRLALCLCTKAPRKRSQSTRHSTDAEGGSSIFMTGSLRRYNKARAVTPVRERNSSMLVDQGSSSLSTGTSQLPGSNSREQSPADDQRVDSSDDSSTTKPTTDTKGLPVEIELQQIASDSRPKPPPLLTKTPSKKVIITNPAASQELGDSSLMYLHNDLIKELGPTFKEFVVKRQFWVNLFTSVVHTDRKYLGWNEKTSELYDRYTTLPLAKRCEFSYEEDTLLSVILHNVLVFLLMMGVSSKHTIDLCHRLSAKTRLASMEEKLLQQTLTELEDVDHGDHIDVKDLAVLSLYSETHSVVIFVVHHGVNIVAPIFKLQITDDVCILRRFPDEKITCRFWNDCISQITSNEDSMIVSFSYKEALGEYTHHFHSKQFTEIFQCLQLLVNQRTLSPH